LLRLTEHVGRLGEQEMYTELYSAHLLEEEMENNIKMGAGGYEL